MSLKFFIGGKIQGSGWDGHTQGRDDTSPESQYTFISNNLIEGIESAGKLERGLRSLSL